jgi:hypothetical protein
LQFEEWTTSSALPEPRGSCDPQFGTSKPHVFASRVESKSDYLKAHAGVEAVSVGDSILSQFIFDALPVRS